MSFTLPQFARLYGVNLALIDYGTTQGRTGLLVSSGAGLMMAAMDAAPFRWCLDYDAMLKLPRARLADFLYGAVRLVVPVGVCGWFSLHDPTPLRAALSQDAPQGRVPIVYSGGGTVLHVSQVESFDAFVRASLARVQPPGAAHGER